MENTKHELKSFIILYIITTIVAFGIVLAFGPNKLSMISVLYTIALLFCGTAIILITDRYSEAKLSFKSYPKTKRKGLELLGVLLIFLLSIFSMGYGVPFVMSHLGLFSLPRAQMGFFFSLFKFIFIIAIALLFTWGWKRSLKDIGISKQDIGKRALLALILFPIFIIIFFCLMNVFSAVYPMEKLMFRIQIGSMLISFLYAIVLCLMDPGVVEEVVFRGLIQNKLERCMDWRLGIFLSSLLFGLSHLPMSYLSVPLTIPIGLIFGYIYHRTQNLTTTILLHGFSAGIITFLLVYIL